MRPPLSPSPLKKGDCLGIFAPAGQLQNVARFVQGVRVLEKMGFRVKYPPELWPGLDYLADSDENRGEEFNRLVQDREVRGIIAMRGGYGCLRMLDTIDIALVAGNPKFLVGFSDITILQNYLYAQVGLVSLHGPVVTSLGEATEEARTSLSYCLTHTKACSIGPGHIEVLRDGPKVSAPLIGGNLASMVSLLGTRYDFSWDDKIVFLEDTNEPAYKIDRMFTQLKLAGKLNKIAGLILGNFSTSIGTGEIAAKKYRQSIQDRVLELCSDHVLPIWGHFPSGHYPGSLTFALGASVVMMKKKSNWPKLLFL
jgi:muramoyltetrapeptide carboxypeptidase